MSARNHNNTVHLYNVQIALLLLLFLLGGGGGGGVNGGGRPPVPRGVILTRPGAQTHV